MNPSKPLLRTLTSAVVVWLLIALPSNASATATAEQLRRSMADIALLNGQLAQRKADATAIRDALSNRLKEIKTGTHDTLRKKGIKSQTQALKNPRVFYNLMLIAEIQAYIDRYSQRIGYYRVACDRLSYLYQQADDDLKIVNTLSGMKIEALISQVEKILDAYLSDAQTLVIEPETLTVATPEETWPAIASDR